MSNRSAVSTGIEATTALAVLDVLIEGGVKTIFGMSGGNVSALFRAMVHRRDRLRALLTRQEGLATSMAEATGRLTGVPGVAMGQSAWLLGNGGVGIQEAYLGSSPVILLGDLSDGYPYTHHAPYQAATGHHGGWDAEAAFRALTKRTFVARTPIEAVQLTQQAVRWATTGQPGPVAVLFHSQAFVGSPHAKTGPRAYRTEAYLRPPLESTPNMEPVADLLRSAERVAIVVGSGARGASARLVEEVGDATGAAIVTTASAKGVVADAHPHALGVIGNFGWPVANEALGAADAVLVVGSKLGPTDTALEHPALIDPERQAIVQIDVEPLNANWTFPVAITVQATAAVALTALLGSLRANPVTDNVVANRRSWVEELQVRATSLRAPDGSGDQLAVSPVSTIAELSRALRDNAIVTSDAGENRLFMNRFYRTKTGGAYLQPAAGGGMGYAVPAALAARLVHPDRQVVAVCGDGGLGMSLHGILTSREERLPIVVVVLNNRILGWVRHGQVDGPVASEFSDVDFAGVAIALGADGYRVTSVEELKRALDAALKNGRTAVVDVKTTSNLTFQDVTSDLARQRLNPATSE